MFLTEFDITYLPVAAFMASAVSFVAALLFGRFVATFTPAAAVPVLFGVNGLLFASEAGLVGSAPQLVAAALYLHVAAFGSAVVSGFWSVMNERFDPFTARRVMGQIAGGATLGGVLGGVLTWVFGEFPPSTLLAIFAGSNLLCALSIGAIAKRARREARVTETSIWSGVGVLARESYPRLIAAVVFFGALMTGMVDYVFKEQVVAARTSSELVGFFALFYTVTGVLTFGLQATASRFSLERLGVVRTVALLPVVALVLAVVAMFSPVLLPVLLLRGGAMVVENSLYRSGYELLFTTVPTEQKRTAKVLIDLGADRLGGAAAGGTAVIAIAATGGQPARLLLVLAIAVAALVVLVLVRVQRSYVASLGDKLRGPAPSPEEQRARQLASTFVADRTYWEDASDVAVTQDPPSQTSLATVDPDALREAVRARAAEKRESPPPMPAARVHASEATQLDALLDTPLRQALRTTRPEDEGWASVERAAGGVVGALSDVLLGRHEPISVRVRAAELLASVPSQRSAYALWEATRVPETRLRRAAALGLLQVVAAAPSLQPPRREVATQAAREAERPPERIDIDTAFERSSPFRVDARGLFLASSVELAFLLFASLGRADELKLALDAITSEDAMKRGTGLEYLDNLLPLRVRTRIVTLLSTPERAQTSRAVPAAVREELAVELRAGRIDIRGLRRRYRDAWREAYERRDEPEPVR